LRENVRRLRLKLWRQKNCLLNHDNAPSHTPFFTRDVLTKNNMTVVPHPPYSPDLAPCDFSMFPAILSQLRWSRQNRRRYWTPSENMTSRMHLRNGRRLGERCKRVKDDYFEGDGGQ
jgi:hypothetical protein